MLKNVFTLLLITVAYSFNRADGIYDFQIISVNGNTINTGDFRGKKILFVNTAANSQYVNQYSSLEQLYQQYADNLIIIAVPSNSFGNEPDSNENIKNFVDSNYNIHYILASKMPVSATDTDESPLYRWLTQKSLNGMIDNSVDGDFFKYLIDKDGNLQGVFAGSVDPMSDEIRQVINN